MCFMRDLSRQQIPLIRTTSDGNVDYDHYRELARRERIKAQRDALGTIGRRLRGLFGLGPAGRYDARLG